MIKAASGRSRRLLVGFIAGCLAACASPPPEPSPPAGVPPGYPLDDYLAPRAGERVYAIDPERSLVETRVYRDGALARMGHDHVVAARNVAGFVAVASASANGQVRVRADLYVALAGMTVDEAELRDRAGFTTRPDAGEREGTRDNMLKSLEASRFPYAEASVDASLDTTLPIDGEIRIPVLFRLHGVERRVETLLYAVADERTLRVEGELALRQTDFGIDPFSVLGGALRVADELQMFITIEAAR